MTLRQYWYRKIYLKSPAWKRTRARILRRDGYKCTVKRCGVEWPLHVHHVNYRGTPPMRWWHFLPFGRLFLWRVDVTSKFKTLCAYHHEMAHKTRGK